MQKKRKMLCNLLLLCVCVCLCVFVQLRNGPDDGMDMVDMMKTN